MSNTRFSKYTMTGRGAQSKRSQTGPNQALHSQGIKSGKINDSDDSDSSLGDTPDTLHFPEFSSVITSRPSSESDEAKQEALLRTDIITAALELRPKFRHDHMPDCFDKNGRLYKMYWHHYEDIRNVREARNGAATSHQPLNVKDIVDSPKPDRIAEEPEERNENYKKKTLKLVLVRRDNDEHTHKKSKVEKPKLVAPNSKRKPFKDTGGISCQPCREKEIDCQRVADNYVGPTCLPCFDAGETCSLSTGRQSRKTKSNPPPEPRIRSQPQPAPKRQLPAKAELQSKPDLYSRNAERPGIIKQCDTALSQRASKSRGQPQGPHSKPSSHAIDDMPAKLQLSEQSKEIVPIKKPARPSHSTGCTHQREEFVATQSVYEKLQRQISHAPTDCDACLEIPCSCPRRPIAGQDILCDGEMCAKRWFGDEYLEKYLGIALSDAQYCRRKNGFWLCPECSYKKSIQDSRGPDVFASAYTLPKYGSELFESEDVSRPLKEFWGLTSQYIRLANKMTAPRSTGMQPLLQVPCIRAEASDDGNNCLINVLRRILKVGPGILVKDKVLNSQMQGLDCSVWMRAVLVYSFFEFVFDSPCMFDDDSIWRRGLTHSFFDKPDLVEMWIQDNRIRTMHEKTSSYQARREEQRDKFIRKLNAAMMPLVSGIGGNEGLHQIHEIIADLAGDLKAKFSAYTGEFEDVMPGIGDQFDAEKHESDDPMDEDGELANRYVMLTTMVGVKFRIPGQPMQILSKAKVRLWPQLDEMPLARPI